MTTKRWISLCLAALFLFSAVACAEEFSLDSSRRLRDYAGTGGEVTVPAQLNGEPVRSLYRKLFINNKTITSLRIEEGVQVIGDSATYGMAALSGITLPETLAVIEDANFNGCPLLTEVTLPAGIIYIGDSCFSFDQGLRSVTFTGPAPAVHYGAFRSLPADTVIYVPNDQVDAYLDALPAGLTVEPSGQYARQHAVVTPEEDFSFSDGVVKAYTGKDAVVRIPDTFGGEPVRAIGSYAFDDADDTWRVIVPDSVTDIDDDLFYEAARRIRIVCGEGSVMESYMKENYPFMPIVRESTATNLP